MVQYVKAVIAISTIIAMSACARFDASLGSNSRASSPIANSSPLPAPSTPSTEFASTGILSFLPQQALTTMSEREKSEAASAQFYALQFGRVGATREWSGDSSTRGEISVGPYIKVNKLDCREFNHLVIVSGTRYSKSGTSCREQDGQWNVVG